MTSIKTNRLLLRELNLKDAQQIAKIGNNKKIWENLTDAFPHPYTLQAAYDWINYNLKKTPPENFAIETENTLIGMIGFGKKEHTLELGYWIGEEYWGKGYATEALRAMTNYIFENYETEEISAKVFTFNPASGKVLEKCEYKKQPGITTTKKAGKTVNEITYKLKRETFKKL